MSGTMMVKAVSKSEEAAIVDCSTEIFAGLNVRAGVCEVNCVREILTSSWATPKVTTALTKEDYMKGRLLQKFKYSERETKYGLEITFILPKDYSMMNMFYEINVVYDRCASPQQKKESPNLVDIRSFDEEIHDADNPVSDDTVISIIPLVNDSENRYKSSRVNKDRKPQLDYDDYRLLFIKDKALFGTTALNIAGASALNMLSLLKNGNVEDGYILHGMASRGFGGGGNISWKKWGLCVDTYLERHARPFFGCGGSFAPLRSKWIETEKKMGTGERRCTVFSQVFWHEL